MKFGYIRVSSVTQNTERQLDGMQLDRVFEDKLSGKDLNRPQLTACLQVCRAGDVLYVHSLDRLARNLGDLLKMVKDLTERGVKVCFVKERLEFGDKTDHISTLMLSILGAFAQFERNLIRERQAEGIAIAKKEGKFKGRPATVKQEHLIEFKKMRDMGVPTTKIAKKFNVSRMTVFRSLKAVQAP